MFFLPGANAEVIPKRPAATFYLDVTPGCYSLSYISSLRVPFKDVKKVYRVSCFERHHYEVFYVGNVNALNNQQLAELGIKPGSKSLDYCSALFSRLKMNARSRSSYSWTADESFSIGNWIADRGPEYARYQDRFACYLGLGVKNQIFFKEVIEPLTKGFEKYDK